MDGYKVSPSFCPEQERRLLNCQALSGIWGLEREFCDVVVEALSVGSRDLPVIVGTESDRWYPRNDARKISRKGDEKNRRGCAYLSPRGLGRGRKRSARSCEPIGEYLPLSQDIRSSPASGGL